MMLLEPCHPCPSPRPSRRCPGGWTRRAAGRVMRMSLSPPAAAPARAAVGAACAAASAAPAAAGQVPSLHRRWMKIAIRT